MNQSHPEPEHDLDDFSTVPTFDPEIQRLVESARRRHDASDQGITANSSGPIVEDEVVDIVVTWKPHPQDENGEEHDWEYRINRVSAYASPLRPAPNRCAER